MPYFLLNYHCLYTPLNYPPLNCNKWHQLYGDKHFFWSSLYNKRIKCHHFLPSTLLSLVYKMGTTVPFSFRGGGGKIQGEGWALKKKERAAWKRWGRTRNSWANKLSVGALGVAWRYKKAQGGTSLRTIVQSRDLLSHKSVSKSFLPVSLTMLTVSAWFFFCQTALTC